MGDLLWLHSGGAFNKEPENDLGNYPSRFEISGVPPEETNTMNNLFDNVTPDEALDGVIDYRCFYIWNNKEIAAMTGITLTLDQCESCTTPIAHTSKLQNDVQQITINCTGIGAPDIGGYVIFDTEFGAPFTITFTGDWVQFATDFTTALQNQPWCTTSVVIGGNPFTITFMGEAGNRKVQLIRVVQNDLINNGLCRYNTQLYFSCDPYNSYNSSIVRVVQKISSHVPQTGAIKIYNPLTGLWDSYNYFSRDDYNFNLSTPLQFNLVGFLGSCPPTDQAPGDPNLPPDDTDLIDDSQNWQRWFPSPVNTDPDGNPQPLSVPWGVIEAPCESEICQITVEKIQDGGPINTIAAPIPTEDVEPDIGTNTFGVLPILVGNLRPNEGFYWWIQRTIPPGTSPCMDDFFSINASGTKVSWPLTTP
jgi:hypothetical protein